MFRKQILAQLKVKYPGVSEKVLGLIADKLVAKVTAEDEIEGVLTELENSPISIKDYADFLQKEGDRRVTEATKKKTTEEEGTPPAPEGIPEDAPSYVKQLLKSVETLGAQVNTLVSEKRNTSVKSKLAEAIGKDVPETFYKRIALPENEDDIAGLAEEIKADWTSLNQDRKNAGMSVLNRKLVTGSEQEGAAPKVSAEILAFAEKNGAKKETI
jgi:hypothetical protein